MRWNPSHDVQTITQVIALALRVDDAPTKPALSRLFLVAPPPLDRANLGWVCSTASRFFAAAFKQLRAPNSVALQLKAQLEELDSACLAEYAKRGASDIPGALEHRQLATPAWASLSKGRLIEDTSDSVAAEAIGIELALAWENKRPMALAYCNDLRALILDGDLTKAKLFDSLLAPREMAPSWFERYKKRFIEFLIKFDCVAPPPPPAKTFEEKARSELRASAAWPSFTRRAGVLDDKCMSMRQIESCMAYEGTDIFRSRDERLAALWLMGFSGLFATSVKRIPIDQHAPSDWAQRYLTGQGLLQTDLQFLAHDASTATTEGSESSSFCISLPAPKQVADWLAATAATLPDVNRMGNVIPALDHIRPELNTYPSLDELAPHFARWSHSCGPLMRQLGVDALITGLAVNDLGLCAWSKLYYALVTPGEIWEAARLAYSKLGLGEPVPMPKNLLPFGARVTPSESLIASIDEALLKAVNDARPGPRETAEKNLGFHKKYVHCFGSRKCVWLALREATSLPMSAQIDERDDCCDLLEKSSHGRPGPLQAVMPTDMRFELHWYMQHCKALRHRLQTLGWHRGPAMDWLDAVLARKDVPLLCIIESPERVIPLGTAHILEALGETFRLAPDWGRKYLENALRREGVQTRDIDRQMRHEVLGQESMSAVADGSERAFARRLRPALDRISSRLYSRRLFGLRRDGDKT